MPTNAKSGREPLPPDDLDKAHFITWATLGSAIVALICFNTTVGHETVRYLSDGQHETLPAPGWYVYGAHVVMAAIGIGVFLSMPKGMEVIVVGPIRSMGSNPPDEAQPRLRLEGTIRLQVGVGFIFIGVCALVYGTGGPSASPYSQVLFAQVVLGQVLITSRRPLADNRRETGVLGYLGRRSTFLKLGI